MRSGRIRIACVLRRHVPAVLLLACLSMLAPGVARANGDGVILVFGDSLSAAYGIDISDGWVSLLEQRLEARNRRYEVVNASISGETTRGGAARIQSVLSAEQPDIVIVELGGNDGLRGVGLQTTRRHLGAIVEASLEAGARVLLLAMELPPNYGPAYTEEFRRIYRDIGEREGVTLVPFFLDGIADDPSMMQTDGIHPRAAAQPRMLENVWPYLEPLLDARS